MAVTIAVMAMSICAVLRLGRETWTGFDGLKAEQRHEDGVLGSEG